MSGTWVTRRSIIQRAKDPNDENAWNDFVQYYEGFIRLVLHKMSFYEKDIDDMIQEILLKIWKYLSRFELNTQKAKFRTWLSTLIRNQAINFINSNSCYQKRKDIAAEIHIKNRSNELSRTDRMIQDEWTLYLTTKALENVKPLL